MAETKTYTASLRSRLANSTTNSEDGALYEWRNENAHFAGIIHFTGLDLANKIIQKIVISFTSAEAGLGLSHSKIVKVYSAKVQGYKAEGYRGRELGDAYLGYYSGAFYKSATPTKLTFDASHNTDLFNNLRSYFSAGNKTLIIYNSDPYSRYLDDRDYSENFLKYTNVSMVVTYDEGISIPTTNTKYADIGTIIRIATNRRSTDATHTLRYRFGNLEGIIGTEKGVTDSQEWEIPPDFASQLVEELRGECEIVCETFYGSTSAGTASTYITVTLPSDNRPTITSVVYEDATEDMPVFVQGKSTLHVEFEATSGAGTSIVSTYAIVNGVPYSGNDFTTPPLLTAGTNTFTVYAVDGRGFIASATRTFTVYEYSIPSFAPGTQIKRCDTDGIEAEDGIHFFIIASPIYSSVNGHNSVSYDYRLKTASGTWEDVWYDPGLTAGEKKVITRYHLESEMSYNIQLRITDAFGGVSIITDSVSTSFVTFNARRGGRGAAFGGYADEDNTLKLIGWDLKVVEDTDDNGGHIYPDSPIDVAYGGTGATTESEARTNLGITPANIGAATATHNHSARDINSGVLPVPQGGTGASDGPTAMANLGITLAALGGFAESHLRYGIYDSGNPPSVPDGQSVTENPIMFVPKFADNVTPLVFLTLNQHENESDISSVQFQAINVTNRDFNIKFFNGMDARRRIKLAWLAIG